ncbi:LLM class flavin-dependent oxidoreductase [Thermococcus sp. LS2]|uniref:LLM class flavin-dependent oxidoreductase n=1 Tax=Thermococcus sp. LS2 TaxID=1638260 RepID=UPI00143C7969
MQELNRLLELHGKKLRQRTSCFRYLSVERLYSDLFYKGISEASRNLVAEEADGWLMRGCSLEEAKRNIIDMQERLKRKGRSKIEFAIPALTIIRDTDEEAKRYLERLTGGRKNVLDRTLDTGLVGSPETVAKKIKQLENIGINHVLLQLTPTLSELKNVKKGT